MTALHDLTIAEAGARMRAGTLTSVALTRHFLERIDAFDSGIRAFVTVTAERALADAGRADKELAAGVDRGPLHGIPYALKDSIDTAGIRTTVGSPVFSDRVPDRDAAAAAALRRAGGVLLGKLATYEFGTVGPSFEPDFPPVRNPWSARHITGGSSSGCAAAIAAGFARIAIGSDSGGSIRSPASYCGVFGLKPSQGAVDTQGIYPLSPSLDHVGIMAASIAEIELGLAALRGARDDAPGQGVAGLKLAYGRNWSAGEADAEVQDALDAAARRLAALGCLVEEVALPDYQPLETCGAVIIQAEAYAQHAALLSETPALYGRLAYLDLTSGAGLPDEDLRAAQQFRSQSREIFDRDIFGRYDAVILASTLTPAPPFSDFDGKTPRWTAMRTLPFNITGHPALAVPAGLNAQGLPLGMQIVGRYGFERTICRIGAAVAPSLRCPQLDAGAKSPAR